VSVKKDLLVHTVKEKTLVCLTRVSTLARACRLTLLEDITASAAQVGADMSVSALISAILQTRVLMEELVTMRWTPTFATALLDTQETIVQLTSVNAVT